MDRLTEMEAFATVVDQGGFTDAAKKMGISKSAVSKHVSSLEARLGARLLNRTTRAVSLTPDGETLLAHAERILDAVEDARRELSHTAATVTGKLRVTVSCCVTVERTTVADERVSSLTTSGPLMLPATAMAPIRITTPIRLIMIFLRFIRIVLVLRCY